VIQGKNQIVNNANMEFKNVTPISDNVIAHNLNNFNFSF
jgi:hypothetical protein